MLPQISSQCRKMKHSALLCVLILFLPMATISLSIQFRVGGDKGWTVPTAPANKTDAYNNWARQTRFQIGDTLYFKYANDSVLVVNEAHYNACNANNPVSKHTDGNTVIKLDHHGVFYFISGNLGHCRAGQKLIIDVLADHYDDTDETPSSAPALAPGPGAGSRRPASGPSSRSAGAGDILGPKNSAAKSTVSSAVLSFIVIGYYMFL